MAPTAAPAPSRRPSAALPDRGRMPRTHVGRVLKAERQRQQDAALDRFLNRKQIRRDNAAQNAANRAAGLATNGVGAATTAGFKAGATPKAAARAAWAARKANRTTAGQRARGLAVGALAAGAALAGRGGVNGARRGGRYVAKKTARHRRNAAKALRSADVHRRAALRNLRRRRRNVLRRVKWVFTADREAMARFEEARERAKRIRAAAKTTKPAAVPVVGNPVPAATTAPAQPATTTARPAAPAAATTTPARPVAAPAATPTRTGGNMTRHWEPWDAACNLDNAYTKWGPGDDVGSLYVLWFCMGGKDDGTYTSEMNGFARANSCVQFGWDNMFAGVRQDLGRNLEIAHVKRQEKVSELLASAVKLMDEMPKVFSSIHARELQRLRTDNSEVTNVSAQGRATPMVGFMPWHAAADFARAAVSWRPGTKAGALFVYGDALPAMAEAARRISNGWGAMVQNVKIDVGSLRPEMLEFLTQTHKTLICVADGFNDLVTDWYKTHADDIERRQLPGAHTADVIRTR